MFYIDKYSPVSARQGSLAVYFLTLCFYTIDKTFCLKCLVESNNFEWLSVYHQQTTIYLSISRPTTFDAMLSWRVRALQALTSTLRNERMQRAAQPVHLAAHGLNHYVGICLVVIRSEHVRK